MIICECGQKIYKVGDLNNVRNFGLALYGECPKCDTQIACASLWRRVKTLTYVPGHVLAL